jgi:hypothetical protein
MPRKAETQWISKFNGYADVADPGDTPKISSDVLNVKFRFGRVLGRGGMAKYQAISTASSAAIIGLFNYRRASGTHMICRMLPTVFEVFTGGSWVDKTGTALSGSATTRPIYTIIDDTLIFTNEGANLPRKFDNSGNSADVASSAAPYCKGVQAYLGYLFAFNVSDSGTFSDVFDGHRTGRYVDDWDSAAAWTPCASNEIVLDETPGVWLASAVVGKNLYGIKSDGVIKVRFVGGVTKFAQDGLACDVGCVSPLSVGLIGSDPACSAGAFFLGNDAIIYQITDDTVQAITYDTLPDTLLSTAALSKLKYARGFVDSEDDTYYLFYDRTGLSNQLLDSYVSYNYRTKEVSKGRLPQMIACSPFKSSDQAAEDLLVSTTTLVRTFDDFASIDDDGTAVSRYWTTGWQKLAEEGWLHRVRLVFARSNGAKVGVSMAEGYGAAFGDEQVFSLSGSNVNETNVEVIYHLPSPRLVDWANVKVRIVHQSTSARTKLEKIGFEISNILPTTERERRADLL